MTTLSTMVVTNRPQFTPWWTWSITKQTRRPDEVIVVTNYDFEDDEDAAAFEETIKWLLDCLPTQVVFLPATYTTIGEMRQTALNLSTGTLVNYIDDDDWYHPWMFKLLIRGYEQGYKLVTATGQHRLVLDTLTLFQFAEIIDLIHLPFCAVDGALARRIRFIPASIDEDIQWLNQVSDHVRGLRTGVDLELPVMCMIHTTNTWNRTTIMGYELAMKLTACPLPQEAPYGITDEEWKRTWLELIALRERLDMEDLK